jgi:DNA-binding NarL/FixJ family response regulator
MCEDCRNGRGFPILFYNASLRAGVIPGAAMSARKKPRNRPTRRPGHPTPLELGILRAISDGLTNVQIASVTSRSEETIKQHVRNLLAKLEASNRAHLVAIAYQRGLLP